MPLPTPIPPRQRSAESSAPIPKPFGTKGLSHSISGSPRFGTDTLGFLFCFHCNEPSARRQLPQALAMGFIPKRFIPNYWGIGVNDDNKTM
jgi:hypothetical protein